MSTHFERVCESSPRMRNICQKVSLSVTSSHCTDTHIQDRHLGGFEVRVIVIKESVVSEVKRGGRSLITRQSIGHCV